MVDNLTGQPSGKVSRLQPEIWQSILLEIIGPDTTLCDYETRHTLCNLSKVSRELHAICSEFLCDAVYFRSTASFNAYIRYIGLKNKRPPRSLTLDLPRQCSEASKENPNLAFKNFFAMVQAMPRLRILNLRGPVSVEYLHNIAHIQLEQFSRITEPEPFDFPDGAIRPRVQWWTSSLTRLCLGPACIWDIALYVDMLSNEFLRQVVIQCDSVQAFLKTAVVELGTSALLEAITTTMAKRKTKQKIQLILVERVQRSDSPSLISIPNDDSLKVMQMVNMHLIDGLQCSGFRLYDREMRCQMNLAQSHSWPQLGSLASPI